MKRTKEGEMKTGTTKETQNLLIYYNIFKIYILLKIGCNEIKCKNATIHGKVTI